MLSLLPDEQDISQNFETLWTDQARCVEHPQPLDMFGSSTMEKILEKVLQRWNMSIDQPAAFEKCFGQIRF